MAMAEEGKARDKLGHLGSISSTISRSRSGIVVLENSPSGVAEDVRPDEAEKA